MAEAAQERLQDLLPPQEASKVDPEAFAQGTVLTNSEVAFMLDVYQRERMASNQHFQLPAAVKKTKDYVEKFSTISVNEEAMRVVRKTACYTFGLKQWEHALVVNLMPETPEEACTLIPSLKDPERFPDDKLADLLAEIAMQRQYQ